MALQLTLPGSYNFLGIDVPNCYARINAILIGRKEVHVTVTWYKSKPVDVNPDGSPGDPGPGIFHKVYVMTSYDASDSRPVKQALYEWLKAHTDFATATDV